MSAPIWYLGPDWDLQPLVCPETDVKMSPVRYGGIFQGLSGSRSMTVTGIKEDYSFSFEYLDPEEYLRLEALNRRAIPGPHRLLNPLRVNRLSPNGADVKPVPGVVTSSTGVSVFRGNLSQELDWPSGAGPHGSLSTKWTIPQGSGNYARFDSAFKFPLFPLEEITPSIFLRSPIAGSTVSLTLDWYSKTGTQLSSISSPATMQATWMRFWLPLTAPAGACSARFALTNPSNSLVGSYIQMAAAQVEPGVGVTPWTPGGAAPRVLVDQLEVESPRFPYKNITMTVLEA